MRKLLLGLISLFMLGACGDHDLGTTNIQEAKEKKFEKDFVTAFGTPEANHQWGMSIVPLVNVTASNTRGAYPNGNQWADEGYNVPDDISEAEYNAVMAVFNTVGDASYTSLVDWDCFFVQQVHKGDKEYTAGNGGKVIGSDHMDWLCTVTTKKEVVTCWWPLTKEIQIVDPYDDHIFDFNGSNSSDYGGRMLMLNSDTKKFGYHNSEDSKVHYEFRMEYIEPYGYFVGFDFYGNGSNPNQQIARDYIYNDWVVKIVPSKGVTPPKPSVDYVRIMCEDLGAQTSDFDYNDVVFDIKFIKSGDNITADIILQAAGGTLPLTIGNLEVHNLFDMANEDISIPTNVMVNTGAGPTVDPVQFTVELPKSNYDNAWDAINDLPVMVQLGDGQVVHLTVNPGNPAEMFAVPTSTNWAGERVSIKNAYPDFVSWIKDSSVTWWNE